MTIPLFRAWRLALLLVVGLWCVPTSASDSWVFRRSYYSHEPANPVRIGPHPRGGPYFERPQGAYVNAGYRWNRSYINVGGQVFDQLNVFESWVQGGSQW